MVVGTATLLFLIIVTVEASGVYVLMLSDPLPTEVDIRVIVLAAGAVALHDADAVEIRVVGAHVAFVT